MGFFEKLGIFILAVVVALCVWFYVRYIKNGEPLDPSDTDWKKTRDEELKPLIDKFNQWLKEVAESTKSWRKQIDKVFGKMIKQMWNDGGKLLSIIIAVFQYIGEIISWNKWRYVYIAILLIVAGLILHYVFGF